MAQITSEEAYIVGAAQKRFRDEYRRNKKKKKLVSSICWFFFVVILTITIFNTGLIVSENVSSGMGSKIQNGDIIITNRLAFLFNKPERGEVVTVYASTADYDSIYTCKRVIGLPGDSIDIQDGNVYVNGAKCIEEYISTPTTADVNHIIVPEGSYYVLNDDREDMSDSRSVTINSSNIVGSEIAIIHIPDAVKNNVVYQTVRTFCKNGAQITAKITNTIRGEA